ncbi:hypothetical protein R3P38DRAFT_3172420 [Favolaschia claudopus]|uniref:Uncharacterized protein n=1 Tax=Favolaschia claudopus TaxID=2862362 RepID=A0AAW0DHW3_9AGAR
MTQSFFIPLKFSRLISLFFAFVWSVVALAIGINTVVTANKDKKRIEAQVPSFAKVSLNATDVSVAGAVATIASVFVAFLSVGYIVLMIVDANTRSGVSTRTLPLQYISLSFLALWLFASAIPVSLFVNTRSAKLSVSIAGIPISDRTLQLILDALKLSTAYKDLNYLRLLAIFPWIAFVFTLVAAVVSFLASSSAHKNANADETPMVSKAEAKPRERSPAV